MRKIIRRIVTTLLSATGILLLVLVVAIVRCDTTPEIVYVDPDPLSSVDETVSGLGVAAMEEAGVMAFAPDNALLIADSTTGTIFAFEVEAGPAADAPTPYNVYDIDSQIAALLGTTPDQIEINDLAVHPVDQTAYLSVMRGRGAAAIPVVVNVTPAGEINLVDLAATPFTSVSLDRLPNEDVIFWETVSARSLSITDIDYHAGDLYVAGLSNAEFSSELRRIPYPFDGSVAYASTEIYHTIHDQNETRAPIRTQTIIDTGGADPLILAAYTCTPLVTLPLNQVQDEAHVTGKTIAELGYGNTPIDLIQFTQTNEDGSTQEMVLITHTDYSSMVLSVDEILARNAADGFDQVVAMGV
ncbi:MAG: hypothetical protein AAF633_20120, partial [Chloroflexota bacterium]